MKGEKGTNSTRKEKGRDMLLKNNVKEISNYNIYLDNTITTRETKDYCLKDYKLEFKETLVNLNRAITINLYQYQDIYLNKTNYYLIYDYISDTSRLFKEEE